MKSKFRKLIIVPLMSIGIFLIAMTPVSQGMVARSALYSSIAWVESKGNPNAKSKDGAVGIIQIKPVMVTEVNRICNIIGNKKHFTMLDRKNTKKSAEMFWIYQEFYHPDIMKDSISVKQVEMLARTWNGGPGGHRKTATKKYWHKVNNRFKLEMAKL
jgi:hypothetical protein